MKRSLTVIIVLVAAGLAISLALMQAKKDGPAPEDPSSVSNEADTAIRKSVEEFGKKLELVSLLAPREIVSSDMQKHYAPYLSADLLAAWQTDPAQALGRTSSSPWPDRIEVTAIIQEDEDTYRAEGNVIEIAHADRPLEPAAIYPITLMLEERDGVWRITSATKGEPSPLPKRISTEGIAECLPHKDTSGPQTMECAYGLFVAESNTHYALNFQLLSSSPVPPTSGTKVRIEGVLTPVEAVSSTIWQKYPIAGIIAVTSLQEL